MPKSNALPCRKLVSFTSDQERFLNSEAEKLSALDGGTASVSRVVRTIVQERMDWRGLKHGQKRKTETRR